METGEADAAWWQGREAEALWGQLAMLRRHKDALAPSRADCSADAAADEFGDQASVLTQVCNHPLTIDLCEL